MGAQRQQGAGISIELVTMSPEIFKGVGLKAPNLALLGRRVVKRKRMQHPGLDIMACLLLNQFLVEIAGSSIEHAHPEFYAGVTSQRQAPDYVGAHEMIALALLPPAPTSVAMLKVVKTLEALLHHVIELAQILFPARLRLVTLFLNNTAENLVHNGLRLEAQISKGLAGNDSREETAHGLFSAAIRIVNEVGEGIQQGDGEAGSQLNH